jgi:DNA (cytosine-5)-methyltransferase 1
VADRPRLADLACKAGGAARGYAAAGFDVTGFDLELQPRYPYDMARIGDVLTLNPIEMAKDFDAFHASPSCKGYTAMRHAHNAKTHAREIPAFVEWLQATGRPWILENVEEAREEMRRCVALDRRLHGPITLCGSMFGLGTQGCRLERHRLFIANFPIQAPAHHPHDPDIPVIGVYGGHARKRSSRHGGRGTKDVWEGGHRQAAAEALGIEVGAMTLDELSEAIPPVYTKFLGLQLMSHLKLMEHADALASA